MKRRSKFNRVSVFVILIVVVLQAHVREARAEFETSANDTAQNQAMVQVQEELISQERRWYGLLRARWSSTQVLSVGLGAMLVKQPKNADCSISCAIRGWHFEIEPGLYGIQGGIGWGKLVGESGRTKRLMHTAHFGWNVRGVVLRTWGDSDLSPKSQTLAGIEAGLSIIRLNFSLGILRSLYTGDEPLADEWVLTTGVGWGF
jgi:hypothetical protein